MNKKFPIIILILSLAFFTVGAKRAEARALGCPPSLPTAITGSIKGYGGNFDGWSVKLLLGYDLQNSAEKKVNVNGSIKTTSGYSYIDQINPNMTPPGLASGGDQTFGKKESEGNGQLCVSSNVRTVWFELYPKDEFGTTDKTYFGGAAEHKMKLTVSRKNVFGLRLPTSFDNGGNTGDINGYASYKGNPITPSNLIFRVFPTVVGSACGVQGFSAGADQAGQGSASTYYKILNLAGGQCGAQSQKYEIRATCKNQCGTSSKTIEKYVNVANGSRPRVDFKF